MTHRSTSAELEENETYVINPWFQYQVTMVITMGQALKGGVKLRGEFGN